MVAAAVFFVALQIAFLGLGGLLGLDRRPVLAGVLFGIRTVKPQLGLLLPIIRLLERRWVTIASTVMTIAVLFVVTAMLFGREVWISEVRALPYWLPANLLAANLGVYS